MTFELQTKIIIKASKNKVWNILCNFNTYPEWNPFIRFIQGNVAVGNKIKVRIEPPNAKEMTFTPKVLSFIKQKQLTWLGHFVLPGLFDGEHHFELLSNPDGTTTFIQSEQFSGLLVPFFKKQLCNNTKKGFILMNEKLKELAES